MNAQFFYEMGKARSGVAFIPYFYTVSIDYFALSTRTANISVKWGDGTSSFYTTTKNADPTLGTAVSHPSHTYAAAYTGNVEFIVLNGLRDVYSLSINYSINTLNKNKLNIQDFGTFIKQFPNLYSYKININANNNDNYRPIIKGNLIDVPDSVERIYLEDVDVLNPLLNTFVNLNELSPTSRLKYFYKTTGGGLINMRLFGDLSKLPISCSTFYFGNAASGSYITYTAGKVWASSFDTLSIPLPLSHIELDNLLIDMNNSITTKIGAGVIALGGYRSATSDAAVASLQAKGFTVNIQKYSITPQKILDLDFQNNFTDTSSSALTMVAGGTSNQPTFELSGRKAGEYCAVFNGSQSIKTTANLPINSDKVTIAFWMKTTSSSDGWMVELGPSIDATEGFACLHRPTQNAVQCWDKKTGYNAVNTPISPFSSWKRVAMVIDRSLGVSQNKIYVDGVLASTQNTSFQTNNNGNFVNNILFIGQRAGSSLGYNGSLMHLELLNYPITASEALADYNSFL